MKRFAFLILAFYGFPAFAAQFSTSGTQLLCNGAPIFLKGIGYSPFPAGATPLWGADIPDLGESAFTADLAAIQGLKANHIIVYPHHMPASFYRALDKYNIYYSQDIWVDGFTNDLLDDTFQSNTRAFIHGIIDDTYSTGRPARLAFFSVGDEINAGTIYRTDLAHPGVTSFNGNYLHLSGATPSEVAVAKLIDDAMKYEQTNHGQRHLYTHTSWTAVGPVARPDVEVAAGSLFFADFADVIAMNVYTYGRGVVTSPGGSATGRKYQGYVEDLIRISRKPVLITQTGMSTSPTAPDPQVPQWGGNTAAQAARTMGEIWQDVKTAAGARQALAGLAWFEFTDEWWKPGWGGAWGNDEKTQENNDPEEWFGIYGIDAQGKRTAKGPMESMVRSCFGMDWFARPSGVGEWRKWGAEGEQER